MGKHTKTQALIETARAILADYNPMTVRQIYYQLVSRQVIENTRAQYQAVSAALVGARQSGVIPWAWIEDRLRRPRAVRTWADLAGFVETARAAYRRNPWPAQPVYLECWLEKDALSGLFEDVLADYRVTLNVGRGYDGWDSIRNAADRLTCQHKPAAILYFGDFDPSGEDMARSLRERLAFFDCRPEITKCALTAEDVARYRLPPALAKKSDTRAAGFIAQHGDVSVELDALPIDALSARIVAEVEARLDLGALAEVLATEDAERARLSAVLNEGMPA